MVIRIDRMKALIMFTMMPGRNFNPGADILK